MSFLTDLQSNCKQFTEVYSNNSQDYTHFNRHSYSVK